MLRWSAELLIVQDPTFKSMAHAFHFADQGRLLSRLAHAIHQKESITFLFGSAISSPEDYPSKPGVPDAGSMVQEVMRSFQGTEELASLQDLLRHSPQSAQYQDAMKFTIDCRGQDALNAMVQKAVLHARFKKSEPGDVGLIELDSGGWFLRPAVEAAGQLVARYPGSFNAPILTSNFDPLLEVSLRRAGAPPTSIFLTADGQFSNVLAPGSPMVVHFHGYWRGGDTLHTPGQLTRNRPQLKGCLRSLLRETTLIVMAYGGWSDVFTRTLIDVISEQTDVLNVLWTFHPDNEEAILAQNGPLIEKLEPLAGQRVVFYKGVDCHIFLPRLLDRMATESMAGPVPRVAARIVPKPILIAAGSDHPPQPTEWVGRETQLRELLSCSARVIAITGIGGNGKSTLAAKYLEFKQSADEIAFWCWADCKEEGHTLHTQLVRMIERISLGEVSALELKDSSTDSIIEVLFAQLESTRAVLVFDNIDKYVDVEECKAVGTMALLFHNALSREHQSQFVFTGRPRLDYDDAQFLQLQLEGLSVEETRELFRTCNVRIDLSQSADQIGAIHAITQGHPLALHLIATQVARNRAELAAIIERLKDGIGIGIEHPSLLDSVLRNIWETLNGEQQMVLRYLAEATHPETEQRVASYMGGALSYKNFGKAIRVLKTLNLVVVKSPSDRLPGTVELHPVIRDFIRQSFKREERAPFIASLLHFFDRMIAQYRGFMTGASFNVLENWTSKVELCMEALRFDEALEALHEVYLALENNGYAEEFVRLGVQVLSHYHEPLKEDELKTHDDVTAALIKSMAQLGRDDAVQQAIERFGQTIEGKTSRYVLYCDTVAYSYWLLGDFEIAKDWATKGVELKENANLDTQHDCRHTLALIQRDLREVGPALAFFLYGRTLDAVLNPALFDEQHGAAFYGNIGRCLHFMGRLDDAIFCVRTSARMLDRYSNEKSLLMNRGWAASWLGDALAGRERFIEAICCHRMAAVFWRRASPSRALLELDEVARLRTMFSEELELPEDERDVEAAYRGILYQP